MRTEQEYRNLEAENTRLSAEVERLTKERDDDRRREYGYSQQTVDALQSTIATLQARIDELEAERAARKTAQESLEQYKAECTRLQHEVDRLKGEGAQQAKEIEQLKNAISLSEDSRLMDEYLKLERDNERQAERIKANEQYEQALKDDFRKQVADLRANIAAQSAVIEMAKTAIDEVQSLIEESRGVYGLHLNGDESPWSELEQGGRFERLGALPDAIAAINALPEEAGKGGAE